MSGRGVQIKTAEQLRLMRAAGLVVAHTLERLVSAVAAGITTGELDRLAEATIRNAGATPSFLGYHGYPGSICTSVNDEIVHGIPGSRALCDGDVLSIDCGAIVAGWHGDAAVTVPVGTIAPGHAQLVRDTHDALWAGIAAMRDGGWLRDIGAAVEALVETRAAAHRAYGMVEEYTGHGIGTEMHQDPDVPNFRTRQKGIRLRPGVVLAIEPMLTLGDPQTELLDDGWTVRSADRSVAAHFEHTVALTPEGPWVLTAVDGGATRLEALGVPHPGPDGPG
ncbi:MAG: type I methionyl aminopeptidase [Candidatus Nanopelagicales bacterium]